MKSLYYVLACLVIISSCTGQETNNKIRAKAPDNTWVFEKTSSQTITLDSLTKQNIIYPQTLIIDRKHFLAAMNQYQNAVYIYDYEADSILYKIRFEKEGPDGIGSLWAYQIHNLDSIFLINHAHELILTNRNSKVIRKIDLDPNHEKGTPSIFANRLEMVKKGDILYIANYFITNSDRRIKLSIDLQSGELKYFRQVPHQSIDGFEVEEFGSWNFVYQPKTETYIYNFPNLDSLYIIGLEEETGTWKYAGSSLFDHPIDPLFNKMSGTLRNIGIIPKEEEIKRDVLSRPIYTVLLYDQYKKYYYRIVGLPISETDLDLQDPIRSRVRQYAIMVLDEDFNLLQEVKLPRFKYQIFVSAFFINHNGLHLQVDSEEEDYMEFDIFNLVENKAN